MATWPTNSCGSIPAPTWRRASWPRRETPCTAGLRSDWSENRPRWGSHLSSTSSITATRRPTPLVCTASTQANCPMCSARPIPRRRFGRKFRQRPQETALSDAMIGYWTSFARTGRPQAAHQPDWPVFGSTGAYMAFEETPQPADHLLPGMYEFNEEVVCRRRAAGDVAWNWNVGLYSPKNPGPHGAM